MKQNQNVVMTKNICCNCWQVKSATELSVGVTHKGRVKPQCGKKNAKSRP